MLQALLESRDTEHLSKENELENRIDKLRDDKGKLEVLDIWKVTS